MPSTNGKIRKKTKSKLATKSRTTSRPHKASRTSSSHSGRKTAAKKDDVTYVYECTRPACGYKIWRDEKGEPGQLRTDLKCPKCHHVEFGCLGKVELPESLQFP